MVFLVAALTSCTPAQELATTTSGTQPSTTGATVPSTTSSSPDPSTTTIPPTTTTTTIPATTPPALQSLSYEEVARLDFPIQLVPWTREFEMIATKDGQVWLYDGAQVSQSPILDLRGQVRNQREQGMLSFAVHPEDSNRIFVHYSAKDGDTVVSEFAWVAGSLVDEEVLLRLDQPAGNHNGGMLQFGTDGHLYLGLGDGGGANDRFDNGQNRDTLLGGLVRLDVNDDDSGPELFQYGLRNPWRFWIEDDLIYIADVGQSAFEEVSVAALEPDVNFGWPITEGLHCFRPPSGCDVDGLTLPVLEVAHGDAGTCSITGGIVYRGDAIPEIDGHFFYSDYCGGYLRSLRYEDGQLVDEVDWTDQVGVPGRVVGFGVDRGGEMYVLTTEVILKVVASRQ